VGRYKGAILLQTIKISGQYQHKILINFIFNFSAFN